MSILRKTQKPMNQGTTKVKIHHTIPITKRIN